MAKQKTGKQRWVMGLAAILLAPLPGFAHTDRLCMRLPAASAAAADQTAALQQAIDQCGRGGGGRVLLAAGMHPSGPLQLRAGVTLQLAPGSVLRAIDPARFRAAFIDAPAQPGEAFILADHVADVGVIGQGTIDGSGDRLWWPQAEQLRQQLHAGDSAGFHRRFPGIPTANGMPRPWLIEFNQVRDGRLAGVRVIHSPMWNIVLRHSRQLRVIGVSVDNPADSPNTDGIDIVSSQQVLLEHLWLSTGDDDVAIKSGLTPGHDATLASRDIRLLDLRIGHGHGVSVGSETANGIAHIQMRQLRFEGTENGIRIKSARDRGALIEDILAQDIRMHDVATPLTLSDQYGGQSGTADTPAAWPAEAAKPRTATTPFIRQVRIVGLQARGATLAGLIDGLPEAPITQVQLRDVTIQAHHGLQLRYVDGLSLQHVAIRTSAGRPVVSGAGVRLTIAPAG